MNPTEGGEYKQWRQRVEVKEADKHWTLPGCLALCPTSHDSGKIHTQQHSWILVAGSGNLGAAREVPSWSTVPWSVPSPLKAIRPVSPLPSPCFLLLGIWKCPLVEPSRLDPWKASIYKWYSFPQSSKAVLHTREGGLWGKEGNVYLSEVCHLNIFTWHAVLL